jgi:hypothetical protein
MPVKQSCIIRFLFPVKSTLFFVGERWCTVTVIEESGRRHSLDVLAF